MLLRKRRKGHQRCNQNSSTLENTQQSHLENHMRYRRDWLFNCRPLCGQTAYQSRGVHQTRCTLRNTHPYLNEIDRVGKNDIDELIRSRRLRMKLIISTSLGQAWLLVISHPAATWIRRHRHIDAVDRLMTGGMPHEHDAFASITPREMRATRREKERQGTTDQSKGQSG